ncbi:MAG: hydrogenase iron-sulfur subunit [Candidatus Hodarchaeota archaeon]
MENLKEPHIGVYICHCGGNISNTVDVEKLKDVVAQFEGVKIAVTDEHVCSSVGQNKIKKGIQDKEIKRVIVAACSPHLHLETFKRAVSEAGLNPYLLEMVNIREQDSWVHDDGDQATGKAIDLIRGAANRAKHLEDLQPIATETEKSVLVVGGGIAGIQASLEMADKGYPVYLVERAPSIGGHMAQLSETFPTLDCSYCILAPRMVSAGQHPNIKILTMAEPTALKGTPGNYVVTIKEKPRYVDASKCIGCDECVNICPVKVSNEFEEGLLKRKAIYIPFQQAVPRVYAIDPKHCLYLTKGVCRLCEKACKGGAIDYDQKEKTFDLNVGAVIVSTGFTQIDPNTIGEYRYGWHPDIVTNLQFERIMVNGFRRPSDGKIPEKVAFILCVGSRAITERAKEHCSKICCMVAIKEAIVLQKAVEGAEPWIFYQDIRADGKGYEEFYARAREKNVKFVRGLAAQVIPTEGGLVVKAEDTVAGTPIEETFDLVVLSTAVVPRTDAEELAKIFGLHTGPDGFLLEKHYKLNPVDSSREGIYMSGCAVAPKDVRETVVESMATASKAATLIGQGVLETSPEIPEIYPEKCTFCGDCIQVCPTNALSLSDSAIKVSAISCINCGACVTSCSAEAIDLKNFTDKQLIGQIQGVSQGEMEEPKILVFIERKTAYSSLDLAGNKREIYQPNVRIILVPSCMRISTKHLLNAFAYGADGVLFIEGDDSPFAGTKLRQHVIKMKKELRSQGINTMRLQSMVTTIPQYYKVLDLFDTFNKRLSKLGKISLEKRNEITEKLG